MLFDKRVERLDADAIGCVVKAVPPALACDGAMKLIGAPVGVWKVLP